MYHLLVRFIRRIYFQIIKIFTFYVKYLTDQFVAYVMDNMKLLKLFIYFFFWFPFITVFFIYFYLLGTNVNHWIA